MSDPTAEIVTRYLNGNSVRTVRVDDTDYVSVQDFCSYLQGLMGKIVELTTRQQNHLTNVSTTLDTVCEVLSRKDPELREALLEAAERRNRMN